MDEIYGASGNEPSSEPNWMFGPRPELTLGPLTVPTGAPEGDSPPPHSNKKALKIGVALAAIAAVVGAGVGHFAWPQSSDSESSHSQTYSPGDDGQNGSSASDGNGTSSSAATQALASKVSPALVDINTDLGYQDAQAAGTGIVMSSDGLVLTNNHVIAGSTTISATDLGNGKTYTASVVGYDKSHDIAVIKLSGASGLAVANFGNSKNVSVGQAVVGIGNAGGKGGAPSSAAGTVTALNQSITASDEAASNSEQLTGLIATNAAIEAGDSGGPLVNLKGEVIGVDTAASAGFNFSNQGSQGFAIPINQALSIAKQITSGNTSNTVHIGETAFMGVKVSAASSSSRFGGQTNTNGAPVIGVVANSPAASIGLAAGDTITAINGTSISSSDGLTAQLYSMHPGDKISVSWVDANGSTHTSTLTLMKGPAA